MSFVRYDKILLAIMRLIFNHIRQTALFLTIPILFQCCKIYDKKTVTIEDAIGRDFNKTKRIMIEMKTGEKIKVDSLFYKNDELFAIKSSKEKVYDELKRNYVTKTNVYELRIIEEDILKIRIYNKGKSGVAIFFIVLGSFGFAVILASFIGTLVYFSG